MKQLTLSFLLMLLPLLASADPVEIDGICYNLIPKGKIAEVTRKGSYSGDFKIPEKVTHEGIEYNVTSIGSSAFSYCTGLTSITIPKSVTKIGNGAFHDCEALTAVHISDLTSWCQIDFEIGGAYRYKSNPLSIANHLYINGNEIKELIIPSSVTTINNGAFIGGSNFSSVIIPEGVISIGDGSFFACNGLNSINIPNSVTSIGDEAFNGCTGLTSITIPNSVTSIGEEAFTGCTGLTSITIPNSVTSIGRSSFRWCTGLTSITIPNSVTSIDFYAFEGCTGLTSITIPNSVTNIGEYAFFGCSGLTSISIGSNIKKIGRHTFSNCPELTDVTCLAELLTTSEWGGEGLYTDGNAFEGSYIEYTTLHVPASAINAYKTTAPWSGFGKIVAIDGGDTPETKKCAKPTITFDNGKIKFYCETEGVEFVSNVSTTDTKDYYDAELSLSYKYKVTVYATKNGYENSDTATAEFTATGKFGDLDGDGKVNVADHVKLSNIIMGKDK